MRRTEIEYLYDYDRWATGQVLDAALGLSAAEWQADSVIGERGIGGILVHALGAHERWRIGFERGRRSPVMREEGPLPGPDELREAWQAEWALVREFIAGLDEARLDTLHGEAPLWQGLLHLINHSTQHRSEAAVILTAAGASPGDLDIVRYNFERLHDVLD